MRAIRSALFALIFYTATLIILLVAMATALVSRRALAGVALLWARWFDRCARLILDIRSRVEGRIPAGAVLIAAKHQAMYETLELVRLLDAPGVVVKRELGALPLWGWVARRYGVIPVDRSGGAAALRHMVKAAQAVQAEGRAIVIFPEGTRVKPGATPPLQPGFAGLYRSLGLPVVPVALDSGRLWSRRALDRRAGVVTIRFGDPIPPGLARAEIESQVHAAINALET